METRAVGVTGNVRDANRSAQHRQPANQGQRRILRTLNYVRALSKHVATGRHGPVVWPLR
jgi:hypothetical protein